MITGIGCDVVELERIEKVLQRHEKAFLEKVLSLRPTIKERPEIPREVWLLRLPAGQQKRHSPKL